MQAGRWGEAPTPVLAFRFVVVVFYLKPNFNSFAVSSPAPSA